MARQTVGTIGTVSRVEPMRSSVNGNPRYRVHLTDGRTFPTAPDAMWAYGATNASHRQSVVWFALEPCRLRSDDWQIAYGRDYWTLPAHPERTWESVDAPVYVLWHGGVNYAASYVADDTETVANVGQALELFEHRASGRDPFYPNVDGSEAWIYLSDPRDSDDPYPDFTVTRNPDGETTVTPA